MKVCILGSGLTSLSLAKTLVQLGIQVDIFSKRKKKNFNKVQTLGISKSNIEFFNKNILNINKQLWNINEIEIYSENLKNEKILKFGSKNQQLFFTIKNSELFNNLFVQLNKNKLVKFKNNFNYHNFKKDDYKLIFNCENNNLISKKFFYKKLNKNYNSSAFTTIIKHKKILNNFVASQIFTKIGPIAFLPLSETETSVVYSVKSKQKIDLNNLIKKYNTKYEIHRIENSIIFDLKSSSLRFYYHENILAFGDLLHRLHPLAGQGFNMSIRDIKEIYTLVKLKIDNGLDLDKSILSDFENITRHKNFLFSNGIDFIYEIFNFENKINNNIFSRSIKFFGNNKIVNKFFTKYADNGIII